MVKTNFPKFTALLPMKKNSVRVKSKNTKSFSGAPLYTYILNTLIQLDWIDEIIINTDSEEIGDVARTFSQKIKIHWRDENIRGDDVSMNKIIENDFQVGSNEFLIQTHATNPLLNAETLSLAKDLFLIQSRAQTCDSLFAVNQLQSRLYNSQLSPINHDPSNLIPTQDLSPIYEENSCFYFFTKESFLKSGARIGMKPTVFPVPKNEAVDIDTEEDFRLAEMMMNYRKEVYQPHLSL
jgi:CMP-N-acetylneuraminic acid synthetase